MAKFKPHVSFFSLEKDKNVLESYPTYQLLKSKIFRIMKDNRIKELSVYRSRRAEWGEWWEKWEMGNNGKPHIIKQGWQ